MAVSAIDTIGHLAIMSSGNRWALKKMCLHASYVFAIPMKEKSAENVVQPYLSGILAHKGRRVAILSNNGTEFKNGILNEACSQLGIKIFSPTHFIQKEMKELRISIIF